MGSYGVGDLARLAGVSVRTVQFYDREGLLTADRSAGGRRRYTDTHLARLLQIRLLVDAGVDLATAGEVVDRHRDTGMVDVLAYQIGVLSVAELRLRSQRVVLEAVASVLDRHPDARVPAQVLTAAMNVDRTLLRYPEMVGARIEPPALSAAQQAQAIEGYFAWKAVAIRAVILIDNGIGADSATGRWLGELCEQAIRVAIGGAGDGIDLELARAHHDTEQAHEHWPEADRRLHLTTKEFLDRCLQRPRAGPRSRTSPEPRRTPRNRRSPGAGDAAGSARSSSH